MNDPLNVSIPLAGVETSFPLLAEANYPLQIVESKVQPDYEKTGLEWALVFATTEPSDGVDGRPVKPGTKVYPKYSLGLQERTDGKNPGMWLQNLGLTVDAIMQTTKENRPDFNTELVNGVVGRIVLGHVIHDTDKNGVTRNKVTSLKALA